MLATNLDYIRKAVDQKVPGADDPQNVHSLSRLREVLDKCDSTADLFEDFLGGGGGGGQVFGTPHLTPGRAFSVYVREANMVS